MKSFDFTSKLPKNSKWILEFTQGPHSAHLFQVKKTIFHQKTKFQTIDIVELFKYGKTLFLDEKLQVTESDEFLYHEPIIHPALITHPNPRRVLIVGGADGGAAYQVLKHKSVKEVFLVDIDGELIKTCQKYLKEISRNIFKDPRLKVVPDDGRKFLDEEKGKFDVIINDLTAPVLDPPSYLLFTEKFYKIVYDKLNTDGIFSLQADSANHLNDEIFTAVHKTLEKVFPIIKGLQTFIPSYDDSWGFIVASKKYDPTSLKEAEILKRIKARGLTGLQFYDEKTHNCLFNLPKKVKENIKKQKKIIRDNSPIITSQ